MGLGLFTNITLEILHNMPLNPFKINGVAKSGLVGAKASLK